jgi:hypothetical protein
MPQALAVADRADKIHIVIEGNLMTFVKEQGYGRSPAWR